MVRGGGIAAYFARVVTWLRRRTADPSTMFAILAICIMGLLWPRIKRRYELQRHPERARLVEGRRLLDRVDRKTKKRGYARTQAETLHQFADRIDFAEPENVWLSSAARWYRRYAEQRYRSQLDLDDLREAAPTDRRS